MSNSKCLFVLALPTCSVSMVCIRVISQMVIGSYYKICFAYTWKLWSDQIKNLHMTRQLSCRVMGESALICSLETKNKTRRITDHGPINCLRNWPMASPAAVCQLQARVCKSSGRAWFGTGNISNCILMIPGWWVVKWRQLLYLNLKENYSCEWFFI